jgi:dynein assembly factor 3, axonemal
LYQVFKTWLEDVECDMLAWREKRLRQYYEDRYDYRKNLIDWDYSMSVKDWAEIIHSKAPNSQKSSVRSLHIVRILGH